MDALLVAEALSHAITSQNVAGINALYSDATVTWRSYDREEYGCAVTIKFFEAFFEAAEEIRYTDVRRVRTEEGYLQQHVIHTTLKDGTRFEPRPVCIVAKVEDGKVLRIDEYIEARRLAGA